jgi:hypothetical protein
MKSLTKFEKAKRFKKKHPKPQLVDLPNIYRRRLLDNEVVSVLPFRGPLNGRTLRKRMSELMRTDPCFGQTVWYDDTDCVAKLNEEKGWKPKLYQPPKPRRRVAHTEAELEQLVRELLSDLGASSDPAEKKKIRRILRSRGWTGGLRHRRDLDDAGPYNADD